MDNHPWVNEFPGAITVCDSEGIILEMNDRAEKMFLDQGGKRLVGSNLLDCHPDHARTKLRQIMEEKRSNVYTVEKNGRRKLIYQTPWHIDGQYRGFVEIVLELPEEVPHFIRKE
jgi:PAS domain S-box-containing protein